MTKAILLDTNALTALFQGEAAVLDAVAKTDCVYASAIVIGELEAGFRGGSRYAENLEVLERFRSNENAFAYRGRLRRPGAGCDSGLRQLPRSGPV